MTRTAVAQLALRMTGRILATISLVALYGSIAVAIAFGFSSVYVWIWMAALTAATAGCLCLIGFLAGPSTEKGKVTGEATLGFLPCRRGCLRSLPILGSVTGVRFTFLGCSSPSSFFRLPSP